MRIDDISAVYVINLARREDRWVTIQAEWSKTGVDKPLNRFIACDGNAFTPPKSWDVGRGAYGCYLSHISIMVEAVRNSEDNFLILEDDAVFADDFGGKLELCLADLPNDYDQLYLGWQALHTGRVPPTKITEHLGRAGNNNRNHGILYSLRGATRILPRLTELADKKRKHHIDHWMGELHEELLDNGEHAFNVFNCLPQIVFQGPSQSDICGKLKPLNKWLYHGPYLQETKQIVEIISYHTVYGTLGRNGLLGYEGRKTDVKPNDKTSVLSLHAPSELIISTDTPISVVGRMNTTGRALQPVRVIVDNEVIGTVQAPGDKTAKHRIATGEHTLKFEIPKGLNSFSHTYWQIEK